VTKRGWSEEKTSLSDGGNCRCKLPGSSSFPRNLFFAFATARDSIQENIGAVNVERTTGDLREIDSASSKIKVGGARYPERLEQLTGR
jgi:hypothetical protein